MIKTSLSLIIVLLLAISITPVYAEVDIEKLKNFHTASQYLDEFIEKAKVFRLVDDKTVSDCQKGIELLELLNTALIISHIINNNEIYERTLLSTKMVGLLYLIDCTSKEYHETNDMLSLWITLMGYVDEYEIKYGESFDGNYDYTKHHRENVK